MSIITRQSPSVWAGGRYLLSGLHDIRAGAVVLAAAETAAVRGVFTTFDITICRRLLSSLLVVIVRFATSSCDTTP